MTRRLGISVKNGLYAVFVALLLLVLRVLFRLRVEGRSNIKQDEAYIVVARHRSYWDAPVIAVAMGLRNRVHFISRKGLMKSNVLLQLVIRAYSTIIDRENFGKSDFRRMLDSMRRERLVVIFPEGTTKRQVDAKTGAVYFAQLADKPILPVNIRPEGPYPPKYPFGFPRVSVSIGAPVSVADLEAIGTTDESRSQRLRAMSNRLMEMVDRT